MTYTSEGWHPETDNDPDILRAELDACKAEIDRLRSQNHLLHQVLEDKGAQSFGCGVFRVTPA